MKCAIMQPHYLPWPGYFNLMAKVDKFVFLDDAQYSKNSWHNRNIILNQEKKSWLTIPLKKSSIDTTINNKIVDDTKKWQVKHSKTITQSYSKHSFIKDINEYLLFFNSLNFKTLSEYNIEIIKYISKKLNIKTNFISSSNLSIAEKRTKKVINILEKIEATEYFSAAGATEYLDSDNYAKLTSVKLTINNYKNRIYFQKNLKDFISNLSIIDIIANIGWNAAASYVKNDA